MAKNPPPGDGHRIGAVRGRSQVKAPNGNWVKRDTQTGRFMDQKTDGKPLQGRPSREVSGSPPQPVGASATTLAPALFSAKPIFPSGGIGNQRRGCAVSCSALDVGGKHSAARLDPSHPTAAAALRTARSPGANCAPCTP